MKRILLPTDFSDNAYNAIRYALLCFEDEECLFILLNTFTPASFHIGYVIQNPMPNGLEYVSKSRSEKEMARTLEKINQEFANPKHRFERISAFNTLLGEITPVIKKYDIDLIVMGTKGATGAKEIFIGSNTMYTIKKAKCPVLAVPSGFEYEKPKAILLATDYRVHTTNPYLPILKEISTIHLSRIHVLHAYYGVPLDQEQEEVQTFLDTFLEDHSPLFHSADGLDVIEAIEDFQKHHVINLLVMIHNKHSFFENLLFTPVINQMVYHTNIPFLVIPSEQRLGIQKENASEKIPNEAYYRND